MTAAQPDPFATAESNPSLSFKDAPIGTSYTGSVVEAPQMVHGRDYETGKLAYWDDGNPRMTVVTTLEINGQHWGLWAGKGSELFKAIAAASKAVDQPVTVGGRLTVTFVGEEPGKNPRLSPKKLYTAVYQPPAAFGGPQQPMQQPAQQQAAWPSYQPAPQPQQQSPWETPAAQPQQSPWPAQQPVQQPVQQPAQQPMQAPTQQSAPAPAAAQQSVPTGPTPQQIAALEAAGVDPATVFPGFQSQSPPF